MARHEAQALFDRGVAFWTKIVICPNNESRKATKKTMIENLNREFEPFGVKFGRGFFTEEHMAFIPKPKHISSKIKYDVPKSYMALCDYFAHEPDGGLSSARRIQQWFSEESGPSLNELTPQQKLLAVLSHFSETSRGYGSYGVNRFESWMTSIGMSETREQAQERWRSVNTSYSPSLTYRQDQRDFIPGNDETSSDHEMDSDIASDSDDLTPFGALMHVAIEAFVDDEGDTMT